MPACQPATCDSLPDPSNSSFCNLPTKAQEFLKRIQSRWSIHEGLCCFARETAQRDLHALFRPCEGFGNLPRGPHDDSSPCGAGSVLGMSAAFSEEPYETTVETLEPCNVRVLRASALRMLMRDFPQVAVAMARTLAAEYKAAFEEARRIALPTSPAGRLACLLLDGLPRKRERAKATRLR